MKTDTYCPTFSIHQVLDELGIGVSESVPEAPRQAAAKEEKSGEEICRTEQALLTKKSLILSLKILFFLIIAVTESDPVLSELEIRLNNLRQS